MVSNYKIEHNLQ